MTPAKKKSVKKAGSKTGTAVVGPKVPQPHGGAIWQGAPANPVAGTGRPPDEIRAKMRELGAAKSVPFLEAVLDDTLPIVFVGTCAKCKHEQALDGLISKRIAEDVKASIDQRLKAAEQTFKYGLATKELVVASSEAAAFFDCVHTAIVELSDTTFADRVKARALALMESKA